MIKKFNVFEITGMSTQEIRHSNTLAWLLGDNEHNIEDYFFVELLKKCLSITQKHIDEDDYPYKKFKIDELKKYIYLPERKREIEIRREYKNIDILVIDRSNRHTFVIENKLDSSENENQLYKYYSIVSQEFLDFNNFYIFLSKYANEPDELSNEGNLNRQNYLLCSYNEILEIIDTLICLDAKENKQLLEEFKIILKSYKDLLIRRNIVENKELQELCSQIWSNPEYCRALDILFNNKPDKISQLLSKLIDNDDSLIVPNQNSNKRKYFIPIDLDIHPFIRKLQETAQGIDEKGVWEDKVLLFRIYVSGDYLCWCLVLLKGSDKVILDGLNKVLKDIKNIKNDRIYNNYSAVRLISKTKICKLDDEEIEEKTRQEITQIKRISENILKKLNELNMK